MNRSKGLLWVTVIAALGCGGGAEEAAPDLGFVPGAAARSAMQEQTPEIVDSALLRETFVYGGGARDPWLSLLAGDDGGPQLRELQVISIAYDPRFPARSLAVLRSRVDGRRFRVRRGESVGMNRVIEIRQHEVVFSVQDFGFVRQETLAIRRPEEN